MEQWHHVVRHMCMCRESGEVEQKGRFVRRWRECVKGEENGGCIGAGWGTGEMGVCPIAGEVTT